MNIVNVARASSSGAPTAATDLCYLTATEAIKRFKSKELSPVDLLEAVIRQCERVNPQLNALTFTYFERARLQAREAEAKYLKGGNLRALEGVPFALKDLHPIKGEFCTWGSKIYEGVRAEFTAPTVQRLLDAGVIVHTGTTISELAHAAHAETALWGLTRNPWNLDYGPGGSSGGAAAAVAAGMTTLADGTDGGGSIRTPASACGVFGYKPPFGRNPLGLLETNFETYLHFGPITRSVADAALMQNVMSGSAETDIMTELPKVELPLTFEGIKGCKIAFSPNLGYVEVDPEVAANTLAAVDALKELGCKVEEVDLGWSWSALDVFVVHWESLCAALASQHLPRWESEMDPYLVKSIKRGQTYSAMQLRQTEFVRTQMYKSLGPILHNYDALVCPTLAIPAVRADHKCDDPNFRINGKQINAYVGWVLTYPFNLLSQCPAATVPSGFSKSGVPTGMQIVGRPYDDLTVFRVAAAFEAIRPWVGKVPQL